MSGKEKKNGSLNKIICIGAVILSALVTLLFLVMNIVFCTAKLSAALSIIWLVYSIVILVRSKQKLSFLSSIAGCIAAVPVLGLLALSSPIINSSSPWKYNYQRQYIELYSPSASEDFPDTLPEDIGDYKFEYTPSIMQGNGHCSVRFTASEDSVRAFENEYAPSAIYALPLSQFDESGNTKVEKKHSDAVVPYGEDNHLSVFIDQDFWGGTEATVYVLSAVLNWNHPHSNAVIISSDHSKIQFSQY